MKPPIEPTAANVAQELRELAEHADPRTAEALIRRAAELDGLPPGARASALSDELSGLIGEFYAKSARSRCPA